MTSLLHRTAFTTSRLLEYFSERELTLQLGVPRAAWMLALLKELIDNALDAAEAHGAPPGIAVTVADGTLTVADNGPGLPLATIEGALDYSLRISDKRGYVAPTRGQLGNALKCLFAAPFVADGQRGRVSVEANGARHQVAVTLDRIRQVPTPTLTTTPDPAVKTGTVIAIEWPDFASYLAAPEADRFYRGGVDGLLRAFALLNPHATFRRSDRAGEVVYPASERAWRSWGPSNPTSAHWYAPGDLADLIAHYLATGEPAGRRSVRDFVREFDGLTGTARARDVLETAGLAGATLGDLARNGDIDGPAVTRLLAAMRAASRPVKPQRLGVLGQGHLAAALHRDYGATPDSVRYTRRAGLACSPQEGGPVELPYVLEVAFGVRPDDAEGRQVVIGLNHSPARPGAFGFLLDQALGEARADHHDPVVLAVSLTCPRLDFYGHDKGTIALAPAIRDALVAAVAQVTKAWAQAARSKDKERRMRTQALDRLRRRQRAREFSIKDAAYHVMARAYALASDNGQLPANARQVMYAARPLVLEFTGGKVWGDSAYFTQTLLPDYVELFADEAAAWDVIYDARGHLTEPHTGHALGVGTLEVRQYVRGWAGRLTEPRLGVDFPYSTTGPAHRYAHALFIEKEGFTPLLERARIAARYDLAIFSSKGMTTTATRQLVAELSRAGVTILVAHDFDKSGLEILASLRKDTRRHTWGTPPRVIDLGLRLADVQALGLASEPVDYRGNKNPRVHLEACGATAAEAEFLARPWTSADGYRGERVELNAMTARQFLDWLEAKLAAHGVAKVVPEDAVLAETYDHARRLAGAERAARRALDALPAGTTPVPADLEARVRDTLAADPELSWDAAVTRLAREDDEAA